jgi:serine/threonine-protein kinase
MQSAPNRIGKYELLSRLGRGGMGEVYKAFDPHLQRYVAIKVLLATSETDSELIERFQREARAVAQLRHPNIVQVFGFDIEGDKPYMVMEYVEGETLAQRMARYHKSGQLLPTDEVIRLLQQLCSAVDYAHKQGMLHRDIKPANVILNRQNDAILTDFGLAKIAGVSGLTASGMVVGTPHYMSPEQAQGQQLDGRSDVYSLSVMLYELLAGKLPFDADTPVAIIMQHITTTPPPIELANPTVPRSLAQAALVGMAKQPNERFRTAGALGAAIGGSLNQPQLVGTQTAQRAPGPDLSTQTAPAVSGEDLPPTLRAAAAPTTPTPQGPPSIPPGFTSTPPKRASRLGKWAIVGLIVMLLAISGGILALALGNKSGASTTTNTVATTVGAVTFTDSDPSDFTHPADTLAAAFSGLRQPAAGSNFFAWLCDTGTSSCISLGAIRVDSAGHATFSQANPNTVSFLKVKDSSALNSGGNLIFEITQEQTEASSPPSAPSKAVIYQGKLRSQVLLHIRHQLALFPKKDTFVANTTALDTGLGQDALILQQLSQQLESDQAGGNLAAMQTDAQEIVNLIQGGDAQKVHFSGANGLSDDGFGMGTMTSDCNGGQSTTYLPLAVEHACLAAQASGSAALNAIFIQIQTAGATIASLLTNITNLAQAIATAQSASAVSQQVSMLKGDAGSVLMDAQQILTLSQKMATINVSSV